MTGYSDRRGIFPLGAIFTTTELWNIAVLSSRADPSVGAYCNLKGSALIASSRAHGRSQRHVADESWGADAS